MSYSDQGCLHELKGNERNMGGMGENEVVKEQEEGKSKVETWPVYSGQLLCWRHCKGLYYSAMCMLGGIICPLRKSDRFL